MLLSTENSFAVYQCFLLKDLVKVFSEVILEERCQQDFE